MLRHPSFKGLREDKRAPVDVVARAAARTAGEVEVDGRRIKVSNWSKGPVAEDRLHQGRPRRLLRAHRAGAAAAPARPPADAQALSERRRRPALLREALPEAPARVGADGARRALARKTIDFCLAEDTATLVWLANLADIELHTSLSRAEDDPSARR